MADKNIVYGIPLPRHLEIDPNISLGILLFQNLKRNGDKVAQIDAVTEKSATFNTILEDSCRLAVGLISIGIKSGDVVAIACENRLEYVVVALSVLYLGAVVAPINPAYVTGEMSHILNILRPATIFCSNKTVDVVCAASQHLQCVHNVVVFDVLPSSAQRRLIPYSFLLQRKGDITPVSVNTEQHPAAILCSSGTTGLPKGVLLSHGNIMSFLKLSRDNRLLSINGTDVLLGLLPFYHGYGFGLLLLAVEKGIKVVVMPKFEENLFLSSIETHRVTSLTLVPPLMLFLAKHHLVLKYDVSSVKDIICGAAPLSVDIAEQVKKRLPHVNIRQGYGMTEISVAVTVTPKGTNKPTSVGCVGPNTKAKIIDPETGISLPRKCVGELCVQGQSVMLGYYNNPSATAEIIDSEGWLHTGDMGYFDNDGFLYIVDRLKELIKYKGYQVAPAELESVLLSHPKIKDAAVIGLPDVSAGELPLAFVVLQPGASLTDRDVIDFVASKVSSHKWLRGGVRFVNVIPKSASGKILRKDLRSLIKVKL